jgi:hypothetical protein
MGLLRSVISVTAVSVGVAVFYLFGSIVGIWGETRLGILARHGSNSPKVWPRTQEDDDAGAGAHQRAKENGEKGEATGKMTPPNKHKKKMPPPASSKRQAASR